MGNVGKFRSPGMVILLTIITLGIYQLAWFAMTLQDLKNYTGKGPSGWVLLWILFPPVLMIIILVTYFTIPQRVGMERMRLGLPQGISALWGLLPLLVSWVGWFIWAYFIQQNLNELWEVASSSQPMAQPMGQ